MSRRNAPDEIPLGIGYYTVPEAARLLGLPASSIRRWLVGYPYKTRDGERRTMPPLWSPQISPLDKHVELGFRDLVELRFVSAFLDAGLGILAIRRCLDHARTIVEDERPFSTRRFRTDGKSIFFEFVARIAESDQHASGVSVQERRRIIDLKDKQYVFRDLILPTFKDLDLDDTVVSRWRPFNGKSTIVIDPQRAFGQPIATESGVPTANLAAAVRAEGSPQRVAYLFNVPVSIVRDAVSFESELAAA